MLLFPFMLCITESAPFQPRRRASRWRKSCSTRSKGSCVQSGVRCRGGAFVGITSPVKCKNSADSMALSISVTHSLPLRRSRPSLYQLVEARPTPAQWQTVTGIDNAVLSAEFLHFTGEVTPTNAPPLQRSPDWTQLPFDRVKQDFLHLYARLRS